MNGYAMEVIARERMRELLDEADCRRMLRKPAAEPREARPWRARLSLAVGRRPAGVADAT